MSSDPLVRANAVACCAMSHACSSFLYDNCLLAAAARRVVVMATEGQAFQPFNSRRCLGKPSHLRVARRLEVYTLQHHDSLVKQINSQASCPVRSVDQIKKSVSVGWLICRRPHSLSCGSCGGPPRRHLAAEIETEERRFLLPGTPIMSKQYLRERSEWNFDSAHTIYSKNQEKQHISIVLRYFTTKISVNDHLRYVNIKVDIKTFNLIENKTNLRSY
ncbi:unnamed protein product [Trichogramma brassicae]|uniref:Uncharacterized protein n=1 Tax=Trichogramma brassicae TaxID=86971 RepID=A0A6H5HZ79_9HYME|nr:unnamed protein product [Trichogramma brassicae]